MIRLHLPQDLATQCGLGNPLELAPASTLVGLLAELSRTHPGLASRLLLSDGSIRPHLNVFVTNAAAPMQGRADTSLGSDDEIWVIRAVSGG